jgi:hypothetical protein
LSYTKSVLKKKKLAIYQANQFEITFPTSQFQTPHSFPGPVIVNLNYQCLIQNEKLLFENFIDSAYKLAYDKPNQDSLNLTSSSNSTSALSIVDQLAESNPEFVQFLAKKYAAKAKDRDV